MIDVRVAIVPRAKKPLDEPHDGDQDPVMRLVSFSDPSSSPRRGPGARSHRGIAAAIVAGTVMLAAIPAAAEPPAHRFGATPVVAPVARDDRDELFAALATTRDPAVAEPLRRRIRAEWAVSGSSTADLLSERATRAVAAGEPALARDLLDAALLMAPNWAEGHRRRALLHLAAHALGPAIGDLETTLRLEPRHFEAMYVIAAVLEGLGRKREALDRLRQAAEIDPSAPDLAEWLERLTLEVEGRPL